MRSARGIFILVLFFGSLVSTAQTTFTFNAILRSNAMKDTMCDGRILPIFGITGSLGATAKLPARILYCNEGDSVVVWAKSISQGEHHTVHLHGLDVDTRNDGDPSTSFWLSHMQDTTYSFRAKNAGTYLYHCHAADVIHVQMGMYGLIVVRAAGGIKTAWTGGPAFHKDRKWLMSEVDSVWHYHPPIHDTVADTVHVPKYQPHYFLINGKCGSEINADDSIKILGAQGEKILMRMANIGYLANRVIFPSWMNAQIIDSDGRPLPNALVNDTCYIMPGERFSVLLEASIQATTNAQVQYLDMNTGNITFSGLVPVIINGVIGLDEKAPAPNNYFLFPNPVNDAVNISPEPPPGSQVFVYNALGQVVSIHSTGEKISTAALRSGIYFLQLKEPGGNAVSFKFVKD